MMTIIKGESRKFFIRLLNEPTKDPVDLSAWPMVLLKMKTGGEPLVLKLDDGQLFKISPEVGGKLEVNLTQFDTERLEVGTGLPIEVELLNDDMNRIIRIDNAVTVIERL